MGLIIVKSNEHTIKIDIGKGQVIYDDKLIPATSKDVWGNNSTLFTVKENGKKIKYDVDIRVKGGWSFKLFDVVIRRNGEIIYSDK